MSLINKLKRKAKPIVLGLALLTTISCGGARPRVYPYPKQGQTVSSYDRDQMDCENWARRQVGTDPGRGTVEKGAGGALMGAIIGGLIGAATGKWETGAMIGAGAGALGGGVYGDETARRNYDNAFSACMSGKGY